MSGLVYRLCDPLPWVVLAMGLAVWKLRGRCSESRRWYRLLAGAWIATFVLSLPVTSHFLQWILERQHPPVERRPDGIDGIVVLGGGVVPPVPGSALSRITESTMRRALRGAELYREGPPCPIIVCGGIVRPDEVDRSEASVMRDLLVLTGIPPEDIVLEEGSRNTFENSQAARRILEERSLSRVALVTDAYHLPRAVACFRAQGIDVVPVGSGYRVYNATIRPLSFVPHSPAPVQTYYVAHEMIGLIVYWVQGRF